MGIDPGHMSFSELAQAGPADYGAVAFGQAVEHELNQSQVQSEGLSRLCEQLGELLARFS